MALYTINECPCNSSICKGELNATFKETLKNEQTETTIRNVTCMIKGSQKSKNFSKTFCFLLNYLEHSEKFTQEMLEAYLELFTVLFLKSDDIVREIFMTDLLDLI